MTFPRGYPPFLTWWSSRPAWRVSFRQPDAKLRSLDDVRLVVHHLPEYGGWKEWKAAQELQQCLSHHSNAWSVTLDLDPSAMKVEWMEISDQAEEEIIRLADTEINVPIGVAFVNEHKEPGWIPRDRQLAIHPPSLRGCWPEIRR